ncbi:EpsG family protein [Aeromonas dhakensis]|uniref:EpsG family protein n=1 Tax=Aeromonas dhakensis TaxID=196024 RepID=UPI0038D074BA
MIDYSILWAGTSLLVMLGLNKKFSGKICIVCLFILMLFYIGLRPTSLGTDTKSYYELYDFWSASFFDSDLEWLFSCLTSLYRILLLDVKFWIFSLSFIYLFFMFVAINGVFRNDVIVFLLLISSLYFWIYGVNIIRFGISFSIFLYATYIYVANGRVNFPCIILLFAAIGFHNTIIFQALFLFFYKESVADRLLKYYLAPVFLSLLAMTFNVDIMGVVGLIVNIFQGVLPERLVSRFYFYLQTYEYKSLSFGFSYLLSLSIIICSAYLKEYIYKGVDVVRFKFFRLSFYFSLINVCFLPLLYKYDTFSRILSGFDFFTIFLLFELLCLIPCKVKRLFIVLLGATMLYYKVVYTGFVNGFLNLRFVDI